MNERQMNYQVDIQMKSPVSRGLKPIIRMIFMAGCLTKLHDLEEDEWITIFYDHQIKEAYRISLPDMRAVLSGKMSEKEYRDKHLVVYNDKSVGEEGFVKEEGGER